MGFLQILVVPTPHFLFVELSDLKVKDCLVAFVNCLLCVVLHERCNFNPLFLLILTLKQTKLLEVIDALNVSGTPHLVEIFGKSASRKHA